VTEPARTAVPSSAVRWWGTRVARFGILARLLFRADPRGHGATRVRPGDARHGDARRARSERCCGRL